MDAEKAKTTEEARAELRMAPDPLTSGTRREAIEARLQPIDVFKLIVPGYIEQEVVSLLRVTFRTVSEGEQLFAMRLLGDLAGRENQLYADSLGVLINLALGVVAFDGRTFEVNLPADNEDYDNFKTVVQARLKRLQRMPRTFIDDLKMQQRWFEQRVRLALAETSVEDVKNG